MTFSKLCRSKPYTLINLSTETQHFPYEQELGGLSYNVGYTLLLWTPLSHELGSINIPEHNS